MGLIDEQLADLPADQRAALHRVVAVGRRIAPHAVEALSYGVPALTVGGRPLLGVSAAARHLSIVPFSPSALDVVRGELEGFSVSKGMIRFTADHQVPEPLLERLVAARLAELEG
ncbi:MAG TPA: DUF1801 domain-containing protein [Actinotalea sp.]|nr:DUF1801 domain-containing protein [Actinotalea sp.]